MKGVLHLIEADLKHWLLVAVVVEEVKLERLLGKHAEFQRLYPEHHT